MTQTTGKILTQAVNSMIENTVDLYKEFQKFQEFQNTLLEIDSKLKEKEGKEYRDLCKEVLQKGLDSISKQISDYEKIANLLVEGLDKHVSDQLSSKLNMRVGVVSTFTNVTKQNDNQENPLWAFAML